MYFRVPTKSLSYLTVGATALFAAMAFSPACRAADDETLIPDEKANLSLRNEVKASLNRGLEWLKTKQDAQGFWSVPDHPAVTSLVLSAFYRHPDRAYADTEFTNKAIDWVASNAKPDGGVYVKDLRNYNTSVSLLALELSGRKDLRPLLEKTRAYVVALQATGMENPALNGGIGYGPGATNREHPDMSNTTLALEALAATRYLEAEEKVPKEQQLNWQAAIDFITRCQNLPETNKEPWASSDGDNRGGFVYFPGHSMAGEIDLGNGKKALRSYGSMSYAGLLSLIYAQVDRDDPRVQGVVDWLRRHYTLDENPGMGDDGLYYYYQTMAKALAAYGIKELETADGKKIDWRSDLAKKLLNLQSPEGSWVNESGRWWEKDPVLVTTYSVLALEALYGAL